MDNNTLNDGSFNDWRDAAHAVDTYATDETGRIIEMNTEDRAEVEKEVGYWLQVHQLLENSQYPFV